jgi:hypothetical protein
MKTLQLLMVMMMMMMIIVIVIYSAQSLESCGLSTDLVRFVTMAALRH